MLYAAQLTTAADSVNESNNNQEEKNTHTQTISRTRTTAAPQFRI